MSGLREKKKKETEEKIINAAKEIFPSKGYADTTMEIIAEKAEIGVGTLYNYFKSKAEIFVSIMSDEFMLDEQDNELLEYDLENDAVEIIIDYLKRIVKNTKLFGKGLWRELFAAMFGSTKIDNLMFKGVMKADFMFIGKLERLLEAIKQKGVLPRSFNSKEASYAIYSIVITQTILYVYMEDISFNDFVGNVENQIRFLFEGKCNNRNRQ